MKQATVTRWWLRMTVSVAAQYWLVKVAMRIVQAEMVDVHYGCIITTQFYLTRTLIITVSWYGAWFEFSLFLWKLVEQKSNILPKTQKIFDVVTGYVMERRIREWCSRNKWPSIGKSSNWPRNRLVPKSSSSLLTLLCIVHCEILDTVFHLFVF